MDKQLLQELGISSIESTYSGLLVAAGYRPPEVLVKVGSTWLPASEAKGLGWGLPTHFCGTPIKWVQQLENWTTPAPMVQWIGFNRPRIMKFLEPKEN